MNVIIAGSRTIIDYKIVCRAVSQALWKWGKAYTDITEIFSGCAKGVDRLGEQWAVENSKRLLLYPAEWKNYGKKAGYLRNIRMAKYADALIAVWDGKSKGTKHMIDIANKKGLKVFVYNLGVINA